MDKSWMQLSRDDQRYYEGIDSFIEFVKRSNGDERRYPCPCKRCKLHKGWTSVGEMHSHLIQHGMMRDYTTWTLHEEIEHYDFEYEGDTRSERLDDNYPTMQFIQDTFPFRDMHETFDTGAVNEHVEVDSSSRSAYEKYCALLAEAQRPIYVGSDKTVLECILKAMKVKVENRWSDKSFNEHLELVKGVLPTENNYPGSYREVKKILKNLGLGYQIIHACEYGCVLYYKEHSNLDRCPVCREPRYANTEGTSKVPKKVVRYFPLAPRLQRLYMSPSVAKEMRWHMERKIEEDESDLIHPVDGEAWQNFNMEFPEFASESRNVRLGLATDGFNPFGVAGLSHSTWPIVVMPYNLPPSMCMKKEFNILAMLISGPTSPGKCLNVFMRPLIDELKMLWDTGVVTFDRHSGSSFVMRAAVMWTISDFPGLGMLGGLQTKGYKACFVCLDDVDSYHLAGRMAYQGHRRWLPRNHD
ncbi:unnamed protein product [Rhodiola kirilowii]